MVWLFIFLTVVLLSFGGYFVFKAGERHEFERVRKTFDRFEGNLVSYLERERSIVSHDGVTFGELPKETVQGAGYAVQRMLETLNVEEKKIDTELKDFITEKYMEICWKVKIRRKVK